MKIPEHILKNRVFSANALTFVHTPPERLSYDPGDDRVKPVGAEVLPNGDVRLAMYAPTASTVTAGAIEGEKIELVKNGDGVFEGILPFRTPGPKALEFFVNGVYVLHPLAPIYYCYSRPVNYVDIPAPDEDFLLVKDVPHGTVSQEFFYSKSTGEWERCTVYTPPDYRHGGEYPVLYLQHGMGENETGWVWNGKVNFIADNLIAEGKINPCFIVMNNGMRRREGEGVLDFDGFSGMLIDDCIPFIESRYRVLPGKQNRALAGLSMGSMQTSAIGLVHPELFDYLGLFSGFMGVPGVPHERCEHLKAFGDTDKLRRDFKLFFRAMGQDDVFFRSFVEDDAFCEAMNAGPDKLDIHIRKLYDGAHDWYVWRHCIRDFLQLIFK